MHTPHSASWFSMLAGILLVPLALVGGCGSKESRKPVYPVRGKVLVAGKPAVKAQVTFHPLNDPNNPLRPNADVEADGTFTLSTFTAGDGAPAGEYAVTVLWLESTVATGGDAETGPDKLGGRYSKPETSGLRVQVREGSNDLATFQLK
jgi:hypothetical protein